MVERDLKRLARAVEAVREHLKVTQDEFAILAGLSLTTIQRVEQAAVKPRTKTYSGLDQGAGWPNGTARAIVEQGVKPPQSTAVPSEPQHEWSAAERAWMREMSMAEAQETFEFFRKKSEYLASIFQREVMRVKAEAEITGEQLTTDS